MLGQALSLRTKLLLFAALLSIVPFAAYGLWSYQSHSSMILEHEQVTQKSHAVLLSNSISAHYYGYLNEQVQSLTQQRLELIRISRSMVSAVRHHSSPELLERHASTFNQEDITLFLYNRSNPKKSVHLDERAQILLHSLDMRGWPLLLHIRTDELPAEGFFYFLRDSRGRPFISYLLPMAQNSDLIICAAADISRVEQLYTDTTVYGLLESFNLLVESLPADLVGSAYIIDEKHEILSKVDKASVRALSQIPAEIFSKAQQSSNPQDFFMESADLIVQVCYIKPLDWYLVLEKKVSMMESHLLYSAVGLISFCISFALLSVGAALLIIADIRRRLSLLMEAAHKVGAVEFNSPEELLEHARYFDYQARDESAPVFQALKDMLVGIYKSSVNLVHRISHQRHYEGFVEAAAALKRTKLLPLSRLEVPVNLCLNLDYQVCAEVGGDFYDCVHLESADSCVIVVGSAEGNGVQAAAAVSMIVSVLRQCLHDGDDLQLCAAKLNDLLHRYYRHQRASLFLCRVDAHSGELCYLNVGFPKPWLLRADGTIERLHVGSRNVLLGFSAERNYVLGQAHFARGDLLLCYSPGLCAQGNDVGESFGEERLTDFLRTQYQTQEVLPRLLQRLREYRQNSGLQQDITVLTLSFIP